MERRLRRRAALPDGLRARADPQFDLTERERAFLARHSHYDYGEALAGIGVVALEMVRTLPPQERDPIMRNVTTSIGSLSSGIVLLPSTSWPSGGECLTTSRNGVGPPPVTVDVFPATDPRHRQLRGWVA